IRGRADLKSTPVIILCNSFVNDADHTAAIAGADKMLLKSRCPPTVLVEAVKELLAGQKGTSENESLLKEAHNPPKLVTAVTSPPVLNPPPPVVQQPPPTRAAAPQHENVSASPTKLRDDF